MAFCTKCGKELKEGAGFCSACGEKVKIEAENVYQNEESFADKVAALNDTTDRTAEFDAADINNRKIISLFSYLSFLVFVPFFAASESKFARFHVNQGLVLFIIRIALVVTGALIDLLIGNFAGAFAFILKLPLMIMEIVITVLSVLGVINAVRGKAKELPVIGKFKILK